MLGLSLGLSIGRGLGRLGGAALPAPFVIDLTQATVPAYITYAGPAGLTYQGADGLLHATAANEWPLEYIGGVAVGRSVWETRTNFSRNGANLTAAVWIKTGCTAALDQTDLFGNVNGASSLLATAANATCLQSLTRAAATVCHAVSVKRLVGTGTVSITADGGATWADVALTGSTQRFSVGTSVVNPVWGFRIVTSGDKIAVAGDMLENNAVPGPVIVTSTATVTRAANTATILDLSAIGFSATAGTLICEAYGPLGVNGSFANTLAAFSDGTASNILRSYVASNVNASVSTAGTQVALLTQPGYSAGVKFKHGFAWAANNFAASLNGSATVTDASGAIPTVTRLDIGNQADTSGRAFNAIIAKVTLYPYRVDDATLRALTT